MKEVSELVEAISKLIGIFVWPGLILSILIRFKDTIGTFLDNLGEFSFKGMGVEASIQRKKVEATAALVAATVGKADTEVTPETTAKEVQAAANVVTAVTSRTARRASRAKVLWVDDRPSNNVRERQSLEAFGVDFTIAISTDEALNRLRAQKFDAVISDMGRPPDAQAGYTLLDSMRKSGDDTPLVFYAGSRAPEHVAESKRRGALGCTNRPDELFEYVLGALNVDR